MLKISRESEINLINVLIDHDIISGKDFPNIKIFIGLYPIYNIVKIPI